ncbi:MAG: AzlC family ABC transporter permease [Chloroflexota bacterium]
MKPESAAHHASRIIPSPIMYSPRFSSFVSGVRACLPILLGTSPFGMIYGVLALQAGLGPAAAQGMSSVVFAGSAQFIMVQLFAAGAPLGVLVLTAFVVNLRHALYSASVAPYVQHLPRRWKLLLAYVLTDEAYAVAITRYASLSPGANAGQPAAQQNHWYFLGGALALWTTWQLSTAVGIFLGAQVPASWSLDFTLALTFIALVVPALKDRPSVAAASVAGATALLTYSLPYKLGLMVAAAAGILVGMWAEGWKQKP